MRRPAESFMEREDRKDRKGLLHRKSLLRWVCQTCEREEFSPEQMQAVERIVGLMHTQSDEIIALAEKLYKEHAD